ncbi:MAG: Fic family protein, partial [Verrucomicrobia bacterium]|nr:Fic family protein [Verrucomicrobiota bacterium]
MAAPYLFNLCRNHPFLYGNKRTALATCLVFLSENDLLPDESLATGAWESLTLDVAAGGRGVCQEAICAPLRFHRNIPHRAMTARTARLFYPFLFCPLPLPELQIRQQSLLASLAAEAAFFVA